MVKFPDFTEEELEKLEESRALVSDFYVLMKEKYGLERSENFRVPGSVDGVTLEGVEIPVVPTVPGLIISVNIPVNAREDSLFGTHSCGQKTYLGNREYLVATRENLAECIDRAIELAEHGRGVLYFNQDKLIRE